MGKSGGNSTHNLGHIDILFVVAGESRIADEKQRLMARVGEIQQVKYVILRHHDQ